MFGDRRGPIGNGEKSGRGLGYCAGYDTPGCMNLKPDFRGAGIGFGSVITSYSIHYTKLYDASEYKNI